MKVLIINCGSSSIKYQLYDAEGEQVLAKGVVARIGEESSSLKHQSMGKEFLKETDITSHRAAFDLVMQSLLDEEYGVLHSISEVSAVGHRAVHGGDTFFDPTLITEEVMKKMEDCIPLAPLHNPANLIGIREAKRIFPDVPHVAVFDTAFHQTLPPTAYLYALPYQYYEVHRIRRYGFHGTSCRYVSRKAADILKKPLKDLKMVVCHLGNGVTVAAIDAGKSVDTSTGFTPLEGPIMGTRSGDIDPGVLLFLHRQVGLSINRIDDLLNKESGLLGVSGVSNDMKEIVEKARRGNIRCKLAMEMFAYRVKKYIGAYAAALGGIDTLVFTAGIGENSPVIRQMVCEGLEFLGIKLDKNSNGDTVGIEQIISQPGSRVSIVVVPTNEEQMIAWDTLAVSGLRAKS